MSIEDTDRPSNYPFHVVGGSGKRVGSFSSLQEAKDYSQLHPAWSVLTPRLIFRPYYRYEAVMKGYHELLVTVMGVGCWVKGRGGRGWMREYACRFPDGLVYWCMPDELFIPNGKEEE